MDKNIGYIDQIIRIILGITSLTFGVIGPAAFWGLLGFIPLITGLLGNCPLYSVLGIKTCDFRK